MSGERTTLAGWFEEYRCGCVSDTERRKRDLLGYCPKHGEDSRRVHRGIRVVRATTETHTDKGEE